MIFVVILKEFADILFFCKIYPSNLNFFVQSNFYIYLLQCETESSGLNYRCSCLSGFVALSHSNYSTRDEPQIFGEWGPGDTGVYRWIFHFLFSFIRFSISAMIALFLHCRCIPSCISESSCLAEPHFILRAVVICVQILSMVFTIGTGIIIFKRRKCKVGYFLHSFL